MKVLFFIPDLYRGGVGVVASNLLNGLSKLPGLRIWACIYENQPIIRPVPQNVQLIKLGLPLYKNSGRNSWQRTMRGILRYPGLPIGLLRYLSIVRRIGPDVIFTHSDVPNLMTLLLKPLLPKCKVILTDHSYPSPVGASTKTRFVGVSKKLLYKRTDAAVAISAPIKSFYEQLGVPASKCYLIPNPVDLSMISDFAAEDLGEEKAIFRNPVIISCGRLTKQKGQWHLIRAFRTVKNQVPEVKLVIIGDGELKGYLQQLINDLELSDDVYLLGFKANPFKYIANASVFAFPSLWEGFPMALIEAMACGLPVISADCQSGPRDILAPDTEPKGQLQQPEFAQYGVLIPTCDGKLYRAEQPLTMAERQWAGVLIEMLNNVELRNMYARVAPRKAEEFSIQEVSKKWVEIIKDGQ